MAAYLPPFLGPGIGVTCLLSSLNQEACMTSYSRFYKLTALYRRLDDAVRSEGRRRGADAFRLLRLKNLKLAVKRRLAVQMQPALAR
jgi:hypothetical protein